MGLAPTSIPTKSSGERGREGERGVEEGGERRGERG